MEELNSSGAPTGKLSVLDGPSTPIPLNSALRNLVLVERLRRLRNWLVGSGTAAICLSISLIPGGLSNPKWWSNTFFALRHYGHFQDFALTALLLGFALLVSGGISALILRRIDVGGVNGK